jgi:hypothetical protein
MELKRENYCPLLKKECVGLKCAWFVKVEGYNINTGTRVDEWNCTVSLLPMLLIENSGMQRQTGAAVESFRNEMVKSNEVSQKLFIAAATNKMDKLDNIGTILLEDDDIDTDIDGDIDGTK